MTAAEQELLLQRSLDVLAYHLANPELLCPCCGLPKVPLGAEEVCCCPCKWCDVDNEVDEDEGSDR